MTPQDPTAQAQPVSDQPTAETLSTPPDSRYCCQDIIEPLRNKLDAARAELERVKAELADWKEGRLHKMTEGRLRIIDENAQLRADLAAAREEIEQMEWWRRTHLRIQSASDKFFLEARATISHLLDDPETGIAGLCRNILRIAEERETATARAVEAERALKEAKGSKP